MLEVLCPNLSTKEFEGVLQRLKSCKVLMLRLLVKDYKKLKENRYFLGRVVILAEGFNSSFNKLGYKAIMNILERNDIKINIHTIQ